MMLTVCGLVPVPAATVVQSLGPNRVNVIVPLADGPCEPVVFMTGEAGSLAVPDSVAVSVTGLPRRTLGPAAVVSVGVTGVTLKHSLVLLDPDPGSLDPGTPTAESPE